MFREWFNWNLGYGEIDYVGEILKEGWDQIKEVQLKGLVFFFVSSEELFRVLSKGIIRLVVDYVFFCGQNYINKLVFIWFVVLIWLYVFWQKIGCVFLYFFLKECINEIMFLIGLVIRLRGLGRIKRSVNLGRKE